MTTRLGRLPLANGSKAKIRNIMSALYSHAIRWEWAEKNPITSVRQSAKRQKTQCVLTIEEVVGLLIARLSFWMAPADYGLANSWV